MIVLTYEIELLEPCLATSLQGDPNSAVAFDYLPGAVLRGALIDSFIWQQRDQIEDYQFDITDDEVRDLFFNGRTRYLNAYPRFKKQRTLPTPLSWQEEKQKQEEAIFDFAVEDASALDPNYEWKGVKSPFAAVQDNEVYFVDTDRYMAIHIARDRHPNRRLKREPTREVFRYDALAAGQSFAGAIICPDQTTADKLTQLLPRILSLGGSRSGGYGRVAISKIKPHTQWRELPDTLIENGNVLTVTLLSDTLIRDENGQFVANKTAVTNHLAKQLNCSLKLTAAYYQTTAVGGFNRKWGLPLPQTIALKMGSVFVFKTAVCSLEALQKLEQQGIGERRAEGFGSVGVNWHLEPTLTPLEDDEKASVTPVTIAKNSPSAELAQEIANRLLQQQLAALLDERANTIGSAVRGMKKSQLHALRQVVHEALLKDDPDEGHKVVDDYLKHAMKRRVSREQLEKGRVQGGKMVTWLQARLADIKAGDIEDESQREIWQKFLNITQLPQIGGITAQHTAQMGYEYNLRFMAAVLARATKVKSGGSKNGRK